MENREYNKVITYVKERIADGQLHSGDKLPTERELADILSVGRYSIREAVRIMDALGMIESRQGSGNYLVTNIEKNLTESMELMLLIKEIDYKQVSQLRRAMELYAFGCALHHLPGSLLGELAIIMENMKQSKGQEKVGFDKRFHDIIITGSENALIIAIMESLSKVCESLIEKVITESVPEVEEMLMKAHENILRGLLTKDLLLGMEAINLHYDLIDAEISV